MRCRFPEGLSGEAVCIDEETDGITSAEEVGGGLKNEDGFTRFVARLLLLMPSGVSRRDIKEVDIARGAAGTWMDGTIGETLGG